MSAEHRRLLAGTHSDDRPENVLFRVYSEAVEESRGDLFVALGLARALDARGWGVAFQGRERWTDDAPSGTTVCVSMIQGAPMDGLPENAVRIGWARNWVREWATSPVLQYLDGVLASSRAAVEHLQSAYDGPTAVLPIAVDDALFRDRRGERNLAVTTTLNYWGYDRGVVGLLGHINVAGGIHWFGHREGELPSLSDDVVLEPMVDYTELADVYARSQVVIDDMTASTHEFGNQNSRLFEALASGALVITNCANGLDELGLGATPTAADAAELQRLLDLYTGDSDAREALVAKLRTVVLERHTFSHRADVFMDFVERARGAVALRRLRVRNLDQSRRISEQEVRLRNLEEQILAQDAAIRSRDQQLRILSDEVLQFRNSRVLRGLHWIGRLIPGRR